MSDAKDIIWSWNCDVLRVPNLLYNLILCGYPV